MKMAKPNARDIEAGFELLQVLDAIDARWGGPWPTEGPEEVFMLDDDFDADDVAHLRALYNHLAKLLRRAPNFHGRVLGGMCSVICWHQNAILDPSKDYLELHPDLIEGLTLLNQKRSDFLPRLEREAREAVADAIERAAARHLAEMKGGVA